jgi:uncharacterized protein YjbI with pentapeptide repeats
VKKNNKRAQPEAEKALVEYAAGCRTAAQNNENNPPMADFFRKANVGWMMGSLIAFSDQNYSAGLNLSGGDFSDVNFAGSAFPEADFSNAILRGTVMDYTDLEGCDFTNAYMAETQLKGAYLKETKGISFIERKGWREVSIIAVPEGPDRIAIKLSSFPRVKPY